MEIIDKEVYFNDYCPFCEFCKKEESEDPCWDCLQYPSNANSHCPVYFRPKDGMTKKEVVQAIGKKNKGE